jgi:hypothetical protein
VAHVTVASFCSLPEGFLFLFRVTCMQRADYRVFVLNQLNSRPCCVVLLLHDKSAHG